MLVSDPSTWQVSTQELGTTVYKYSSDLVVVESEGNILGTFQIGSYGRKDTKITIKTSFPSDFTCWGGGKSSSKNEHGIVAVGNRYFSTPGGFFKSIGLSILIVAPNITDNYENGDPLIVGARLPITWSKTDAKTHVFTIGGKDVDVYLSYSSTRNQRDYINFIWGVTGKPKLVPVFALGFMVSRFAIASFLSGIVLTLVIWR
jgi:alpha-glucosidase (family GH31 glycosyl hydrolase)